MSRPAPAVSIIMNCRNGERFLEGALSSVAAQTFQDFEVIFWDNQSHDDSPSIARRFGRQLRYFRAATPMTLGEARNAALAEATGRYVAILDVDDRWRPHKLERQVALFETRPEVGLVHCDAVRLDDRGNRLSRWSEERRFHRGRILEALLRSCFISMSTILVRRDVLQEAGGFDSRFHQVEDWDLYLKIAERYEFDHIDDVLVEELIHATNASADYNQVANETRVLLTEFAQRSSRHAALCRRMLAVSRFKDAGVTAYRAFREGDALRSARHVAACAAIAIRHPVEVPRMLFVYVNGANARIFNARFS
jgi:glycosyltransferase involved in cell wall biosynthesis